MKITVFSASQRVELESARPILLSEAVKQAGMPLDMPCNGRGSCGKCRVKAVGRLSVPTEKEAGLLGPALSDGIRLACMARAEGDCIIELLAKNARIVTEAAFCGQQAEPMGKGFGFAVDIGTTTVAAVLCDYEREGARLGEAAFQNPQAAYGADVISRIQEALNGKGEILRRLLRDKLEQALLDLCGRCGVDPEAVDSLVVTGNTTMLDLFAGVDTEPLSHSPFAISEYFGELLPSSEGLPSFQNARIYLPRTIAAFVGSDITCSILSSGVRREGGARLMADIGTNGEMALCRDGALYCCSTAAGPAFEGAGITMGSAAVDGAISRVDFAEGRFTWQVIGQGESFGEVGAPAAGICGSGLIDAVAACLRAGFVDETGRIDPDASAAAFLTDYQGKPAIRIGESGVLLTQDDFRAVQLAKAAVCAGIRSLLHEAEIGPETLCELILAGGFGSYIRRESAAAIGLIPPELMDKVRSAGNAALGGAYLILINGAARRESLEIAKSAVNLELSTSAYFMDQYVEEMLFPAQ